VAKRALIEEWAELGKRSRLAGGFRSSDAPLRLGQGEAGLQPRNHLPIVAVGAWSLVLLLGEGERGPYADIVVSGDAGKAAGITPTMR